MKVAVIGTGTMGAGMARSLQREGHEVRAWNRTRSKAEPLADDGITVADSIAEAVQGADAALTMLFDVESVLANGDELTGALGDGVWLQTATVGPDGMGRIAAAYPDANLLDCPVLGTKQPAEQGKLVPLVSGDPALVERVQPVLDAIASKTVVAGTELGQGSRLKLACNAWLFSLTAAAAQSIALAEALGLDGSLFLQTIEGGPVDSPYAQLKGGMMLKGDWTPSFEIDGGRKDLGLIADAIRGNGVDPRLIEQVKALFDAASTEQGHGGDDLAAVRTAF